MKTLIVFVNPRRDSLGGALLEAALSGLSINHTAEDVEILDLYQENFNPVLFYGEGIYRRDMHKVPEMAKYREQILQAKRLVFIYPIWWGRPPAMLLGYFDRLLASNFAYRDVPGKIFPEKLLKGKEAICISTMKGPAGYPMLILGNAHKKLMRVAVMNYIGINKVKFFEFGSVEKKINTNPKKIQKVAHYFKSLK